MSATTRRTVATLQILTAIGLCLFWLAFFTVGLAPENPPPGYFAFEHAFPVPDLLLAAGLLVAAIRMLDPREARRRVGRTLSTACGGALMFLGALDVSFNLQNGMYALSVTDAVLSLAINLWCVFFGLWLVARGARPDGAA